MSVISLENVSIGAGGRPILSDVSLAVAPGRFVGVLGPNGAGKTTLMRALLGLVRPASGRIGVLGATPRRGNPLIGYMPQTRRHAAHLDLTGFDLLVGGVAGTRWGPPIASRRDRLAVGAALERVDAAELARRPLSQLSGGERQRLLIAQALIGEPALLLLDEPLTSLDPANQHAIVSLVARLVAERGITALLSAHELNPLLGAVDEVLYLGNGQAAIGAVDAVVTPQVLSRLYGARVEVIRSGGRVFVLTEGGALDGHDAHGHGGGATHGEH